MPGDDRPTDHEQLEEIIAAWEEYDRTFDVSVVEDYLAEDMKFLPPGESPIEGKEAAIEYLNRAALEGVDVEQRPEDMVIGDELAVVEVGI